MKAVRLAPIPIISAVHGYVMGGACELALHSTAIIAHAETNIGLVEPRIGVIPGWGGCVEASRRMGAVGALKNILGQWTSGSALDAKIKGFIGDTDPIVMNRDLLLSRAKMLAMRLAPPERRLFTTSTPQDKKMMQDWLIKAELSDHDRLIGENLINVLSASDEEAMWQAECDVFIELMKTTPTQDRIKAILKR